MFHLVPFSNNKKLAAIDDSFNSLFNWFDDSLSSIDWNKNTFKVDVEEKDDNYELTADLPGIKKENIKIDYDNDYMTISTSIDDSKEEKNENGKFIRRERHAGSTSRSFYVGKIDKSQIHASFVDGVLKVSVPKPIEEEKTTIQID